MTIFKFPLVITDIQYLNLPHDAKILSAQMQGGFLCIWVALVPEQPNERRTIRIVGTGNLFPDADQCRFIATVQDGELVWHVFEVR